MIRYLIEKEFKQIFRNPFLPKIIIALPMMAMLVFPWAANQEIRNIKVAVLDRDHSTISRRMTDKIDASTYFILSALPATNEAALRSVETGNADIIIDIPQDFEKNLISAGVSDIMLSANAVNSMKAGLASSYLGGIAADFMSELRNENGLVISQPLPVINVVSQNRFNVFLDYKIFMIPALMVMMLTIICGFLPALNIVSEKELGTIEQLNVSPVRKSTFILSKLIPYWIIGVCILTLCLTLACAVYQLLPAGNIVLLYFLSIVYILVVSGIGMIISNYSSTLQQAMFTMFFFILIMILISGLFTPVRSMPEWAQWLAAANPLTYFIRIMRMLFLKGSGFADLWQPFLVLCGFGVLFNSWAVWSYRKSG
ncbi:ABC transporter permease [Bacteroidia bacterium]|nr:ABC transporter permease [Bacteroidia bacterium]